MTACDLDEVVFMNGDLAELEWEREVISYLNT